MATSSLNLSEFGSAISNAEGYGVAGSIPTIANNPGDLELGDIGYGTTSASGGNQITNFPTPQAGADALDNQLGMIADGQSRNYNSGESLADFASTYSGGSSSFLNNVENYLGASGVTSIGSLLTGAAQQSLGINPSGSYATALGVPGASSSSPLTNIVFIVLGIVLIGIGALSFRATQTIIEHAGKAGELAA